MLREKDPYTLSFTGANPTVVSFFKNGVILLVEVLPKVPDHMLLKLVEEDSLVGLVIRARVVEQLLYFKVCLHFRIFVVDRIKCAVIFSLLSGLHSVDLNLRLGYI